MKNINCKDLGKILNEILDEKFTQFQKDNNPNAKVMFLAGRKDYQFNDEEIIATVVSDYKPFYNVCFHISYEEVAAKNKMSLKEFFKKFM